MNRQRLSIRIIVCGLAVLLAGQRPLRAAEPQTETITFGMLIPLTGTEAGLTHLLGEDTAAIVIGDHADVGSTFSFASDSPACEGLEVGGTDWLLYADATILNLGGNHSHPRIYLPGPAAPPTRSVVISRNLVHICGCWLKEVGSSEGFVQEGLEVPDGNTAWAFFIVTAEFRVQP